MSNPAHGRMRATTPSASCLGPGVKCVIDEELLTQESFADIIWEAMLKPSPTNDQHYNAADAILKKLGVIE